MLRVFRRVARAPVGVAFPWPFLNVFVRPPAGRAAAFVFFLRTFVNPLSSFLKRFAVASEGDPKVGL